MSEPAPIINRAPDYDLDESLELSAPEQFKALGDPLRQKILGLLLERAATTSQLAAALGIPTGTAGHHLQVLARAGLIRVVRTRQVRAMTEKYYGRVARSHFSHSDDQVTAFLQQAMREAATAPRSEGLLPLYILRHARVSEAQAEAFAQRLLELTQEFAASPMPGERVYGFLGSIYVTDWPELPDQEDSG